MEPAAFETRHWRPARAYARIYRLHPCWREAGGGVLVDPSSGCCGDHCAGLTCDHAALV